MNVQEVETGWWIGTYDKEQKLYKEEKRLLINKTFNQNENSHHSNPGFINRRCKVHQLHKPAGKVYMPDMAYSRAYESHACCETRNFYDEPGRCSGIRYFTTACRLPVRYAGAICFSTYTQRQCGPGQTAQDVEPAATRYRQRPEEAGRLFNINCAICHGAKGESNDRWPGKGEVKNIITATQVQRRAPFSMTYGQNNMGSYASQLSREQRWRIVQYIRTLEPKTNSSCSQLRRCAQADSAAAKEKNKTNEHTKNTDQMDHHLLPGSYKKNGRTVYRRRCHCL